MYIWIYISKYIASIACIRIINFVKRHIKYLIQIIIFGLLICDILPHFYPDTSVKAFAVYMLFLINFESNNLDLFVCLWKEEGKE